MEIAMDYAYKCVRILTVEPTPIAQMVKKYRKLHRLTMEELGVLIQSNHSYISQVEAGKLMPSADVVDRLATALNVSADVLLGRKEPQNDVGMALLKAATESALDDPVQFWQAFNSIPAGEQRLFARLIRLSAVEYAMRAPKQLKKPEGPRSQEGLGS